MATLLKTLEEVKEYVSINKNVEWESLEPYIKQADRKYIKTLLGDTLYDVYTAAAPTDEIPLKVYQLFREASANLSWFLYLPLANVQVSDSGISVSSGEHHKAAEWWQIRDLRRSFLEAGFSALDEALKIMEASPASFTGWTTTEGYTIFAELLVKRTDTFNRWFNISGSRKTFLALRPYMLEVHHQYFTSKLNAATLAVISAATTGSVEYTVQDLLQASMVNYTVAKAINSGTFELTANGIYQKLEEFPGYRAKTLDEDQIHRIYQERLTAGEEYYKKALALIEANPTLFTDYETKAAATFISPKNTKSIVSF